jgi:hypothetical protein
MAQSREKWGFWLWIFAGGREIRGVYCSVIGHRLRVGATGVKGKVQKGCRLCGWGVEMWERGVRRWPPLYIVNKRVAFRQGHKRHTENRRSSPVGRESHLKSFKALAGDPTSPARSFSSRLQANSQPRNSHRADHILNKSFERLCKEVFCCRRHKFGAQKKPP